MRVHSWIDLTREQWLREMNAKELLPWHPLTPFALQLVEDELLYEHFDDWNLIMRLLHRTHDEEIKYVDSRQHLSAWHSLLQQYFKRKPDDESRRQFTMNIGLSEQTATEINQAVLLLAKNKPALKLIDQFILHLEELLR
jgi:hypothetical protein